MTAVSSAARRSTFADGPGVAGAAMTRAAIDATTATAAKDRMPGNGIGRSLARFRPPDGGRRCAAYGFLPFPLLDALPLPDELPLPDGALPPVCDCGGFDECSGL